MERERKQLYEVMFIINAQLSEEAREKALARIKQNIEDQGGIIHKVHAVSYTHLTLPTSDLV